MRWILHCDMDAFYAAVEIADHPELTGRPVIVGGRGKRGVVSAASYAARAFGVHSAMPIISAQRRCPNGVFLPVRMARYQEVSRRIMALFTSFTPLVEQLSVDEAFLDITNCRRLLGPPQAIARQIKETVAATTGLTVSVGLAASKLVAKIASDLEKPDGLTIVPPGEEQNFLAPLPIQRLWGVGKVTREQLRLLNVHTIGDLTRLSEEYLTRKFGQHGAHLYHAARGHDDRPVRADHTVHSMGNEETFDRDLVEPADIYRELLALAVQVGRRLRAAAMVGRTITLKVKYQDFTQITRSQSQRHPTQDHGVLYQVARQLLAATEAGSRPIRLLGITVSNLEEEKTAQRQLDLFIDNDRDDTRTELIRALDRISDKFGSKAVRPARLVRPATPQDTDND